MLAYYLYFLYFLCRESEGTSKECTFTSLYTRLVLKTDSCLNPDFYPYPITTYYVNLGSVLSHCGPQFLHRHWTR